MEGVQKILAIEPKEKKEQGVACISGFEFKNSDNPLFNLRAVRDGGDMFRMTDGKYVRLHVDGELMMSDTRMERISNSHFVMYAHGRVFIAGLGVGLILHNLRSKVESGQITEIVVMEKYQDVIDLVSPYYSDMPIKYVLADVLEYEPTEEDVFDTIYFDIWATICEDNLMQIYDLEFRWGGHLTAGNDRAWMNSWMKEYLERMGEDEEDDWWDDDCGEEDDL